MSSLVAKPRAKLVFALLALVFVPAIVSSAEDQKLYLKTIKQDFTYHWVTKGRIVKLQIAGYLNPLPSSYVYFRSEDDKEPIELSGSLTGISYMLSQQFPDGITQEFGSTILPRLLTFYFESDWALPLEDDNIERMNEAAKRGELTPEGVTFYRSAKPPEFRITGNNWRATFHTIHKFGIQWHDFSGVMNPFAITAHSVTQVVSEDPHLAPSPIVSIEIILRKQDPHDPKPAGQVISTTKWEPLLSFIAERTHWIASPETKVEPPSTKEGYLFWIVYRHEDGAQYVTGVTENQLIRNGSVCPISPADLEELATLCDVKTIKLSPFH